MSKKKSEKLIVAGVPEHFNMPWHTAIKEKAFQSEGIQIEWTDVPEGTGRMTKMLDTGETDLALTLTEGTLKAISDGKNIRILQTYVKSPLLWGVFVHSKSSFYKEEELKNTKAAISRSGSGSHLMAYLHAKNLNWPVQNLQFEVVHNLEGAVKALNGNMAQYFMWEHFTTLPLIEGGTFRELGLCPTPWPCFMIASQGSIPDKKKKLIQKVLQIINNYTGNFKNTPQVTQKIALRYKLQPTEVENWLELTEWDSQLPEEELLSDIQNQLLELNLVSKVLPYKQLVTNLLD